MQIITWTDCLLTSVLLCCSSHLHRKQFPSIHNRTTSTCTFTFQNLSPDDVVGIRLFWLVPVRNTVRHAILGYFPILQSHHLHKLWICKEHIILDCIISHNHKDINNSSSWCLFLSLTQSNSLSAMFPYMDFCVLASQEHWHSSICMHSSIRWQ